MVLLRSKGVDWFFTLYDISQILEPGTDDVKMKPTEPSQEGISLVCLCAKWYHGSDGCLCAIL